jgi:hypothetical protein
LLATPMSWELQAAPLQNLRKLLDKFFTQMGPGKAGNGLLRNMVVLDGKEVSAYLESLKGKRCCRQVKFYSGVCALVAWRFCLSRILKAGPGSWSYQI